MRWISFVILACIGIVLQTTVAHRLQINNVSPDLMLIITVHYSLHAIAPDAMIAAWLLGFLTDLCGSGRLGVFAFGFGVMAALVVQLRDTMFRDHPLTSLFVTLTCAWAVHLIAGIHFLLTHPEAHRGIVDVLLYATFTAMYAAALAPHLHWVLGRIRGPLGLPPPHRLRTRRFG
jgi:rod shape-determining protein MreD